MSQNTNATDYVGAIEYFHYPSAQLRLATHTDVALLTGIINDSFSYHDDIRGRQRITEVELKERISSDPVYVVVLGDAIVGCVTIWQDNGLLYVGLLAVHKMYRRKGIANTLMLALEKGAKNAGYKELHLYYMEVAPHLRDYYIKRGYVHDGDMHVWEGLTIIGMKKALL